MRTATMSSPRPRVARVPARAVFARVGWLGAFIGAKRRALTDDRVEGTPATNIPAQCFQYVHAQQPSRLHGTNHRTPVFPLAADSTRVHPQQPVNTSVFVGVGCRKLIPDALPPENRRFLHSSRSGVTCQPQPDAVGSVSSRRSKAASEETARWLDSANGYCFIFSMK